VNRGVRVASGSAGGSSLGLGRPLRVTLTTKEVGNCWSGGGFCPISKGTASPDQGLRKEKNPLHTNTKKRRTANGRLCALEEETHVDERRSIGSQAGEKRRAPKQKPLGAKKKKPTQEEIQKKKKKINTPGKQKKKKKKKKIHEQKKPEKQNRTKILS